jgi:hypothetical protein
MDRVVAAARLLLDRQSTWIARRAESIELSEEWVRRRIRVDFDPPDVAPGVPLPVAFVPKAAMLTHIEITTGGGRSLPLLTRRETGEISFMALVLAAIDAGVRPTAVEEDLLLTIVLGTSDEAGRALELLTAKQSKWSHDKQFVGAARRAATELPILVPLDQAEGRQVVRIDLRTLPLQRTSSRFPAFLLRSQASVAFEVANAPAAESYHLEILAPPGMEIANLAVAGGALEHASVEPGHHHRAHLHVQGPQRTALGMVMFDLLTARMISRSLLLLAVLTMTLLIAVLLSGDSSGFSTTGAIVLLLVPGLLASRAAAIGFEGWTAVYAGGTRLASAIVGLAATLGATVVALIGPSEGRYVIAGAIGLALLASSWFTAQLLRGSG